MADPISTGAALGAEMPEVDLRTIDDKAFAGIHHAWIGHQVLLFRGQSLTEENPIAFSRRFVDGYPEIYVVSNVVVNGEAIGSLGAREAVWHTDMSYLADPPKASMLYALEIPPSGGDTSFCSMYAAYEALPADHLSEFLDGNGSDRHPGVDLPENPQHTDATEL